MKKMKKLLSLVLTVAMVVAMGVTVFADTPTTYTISTKAGDGHTYNVYQIFTADTAKNEKNETVLSNIKWGQNAKNQTSGTKVDEATVTTVKNISGTDQEKADAISAYVDLTSTPCGSVSNGNPLAVPTGYYLIKDATAVTGSDAATTYLVKVVDGKIEIARKTDVPSSEKKVKDVNDSTGDTTGWQDSADYDIGDQVPFQLKGTVAANYDSYKTYKSVFHDKESAGLTFNKDSVKVYVDGNPITTGYTVKTPETHPNDFDTTKHQDTFDVTFDNLKDIQSVHAGSVITVEYTATLNENAVIGSEGNPNTMHLEFSNNPNNDQGGETGTTPDDTVIVFTYKTVINKVDENGNALTGAEFILEKKIKGAATWKEITAVKNTEGTTFTFSGLDDGEYRLRETKTPSTYNTIDDITFKITADHDVLSDNPALTKLNGDKVTGEITFTKNKTEGSLTANIVNKKGSILPSTGGIGTTIFYVIGGILMVGAGVILVSRRRRSK